MKNLFLAMGVALFAGACSHHQELSTEWDSYGTSSGTGGTVESGEAGSNSGSAHPPLNLRTPATSFPPDRPFDAPAGRVDTD